MKSFKSTGTFTVAGKGLIKTVKVPNPDHVTRPEGMPEVGEEVEIDGDIYEVIDVESYLNLTYPPFLGENVGLLIRKLNSLRDNDA